MGSGASTKKYKSDVESFAPAFSEEPEIESNRNSTTDNINQKAELSISTDSMKVNNSRDEIKEAVNRARNESAIGRAARHDVPAPTPPESPAPTSRNRRSGSNPTERGVPLDRGSPQADFIIDEDSGQFDDESPAMNISDINEFLSLQRQQTVSVMKNAQVYI